MKAHAVCSTDSRSTKSSTESSTARSRRNRYRFLLSCTLVFLSFIHDAATPEAHADTAFMASAETRALGLPFSDAVRIDDLLVLSGQLGVDSATFKLVDGGIEAETRQIFSNMERILADSGATFDDIVKCTVMIADIGQWPLFNALYVTYFPGNKPARSAFGANGLALGARVELECWAVLDDDD
jgi:2-iminobutanoate/2-iminopropanoate deaminase